MRKPKKKCKKSWSLIWDNFDHSMTRKNIDTHTASEEKEKMEEQNVLLEFSMSPFGKGESLSKYVSRSSRIIDESGVDYRINPMGTVLEGTWDEVFDVVKQCYERMKKDCNRISVNSKIDYRKGKAGRIESKIASVEKKVGKVLKK